LNVIPTTKGLLFDFRYAGIFTKVNQQKDPSAPPVPEPDNGEERLQLLKKEVVFP
jgi:hypothetical protein